MRHPLESVVGKRRAFLWLFAGTALVSLALQLTGPTNPGILQFEFTWNQAAAADLVNMWGTQQQLRAAFSLGLDYLFMPLYSTTIALACVWSVTGRSGAWKTAGRWCAWAAWGAAGFDAFENLALFRLLQGPATDAAALMSSICATAKFALILLSLGFVVVTLLAGRRGGGPES